MFQNWLNLITSFQLSLPNVLFFVFLALGILSWKLYNEASKPRGQKFLSLLKSFWEQWKATEAHKIPQEFKASPSNSQPPDQKKFSVKPIELSLRESLKSLDRKEAPIVAALRTKEGTLHEQEQLTVNQPPSLNTQGSEAALLAQIGLAEAPILQKPQNQTSSNELNHLVTKLDSPEASTLTTLSRPQVNILKKSEPLLPPSLSKPDRDYSGYVAIQEAPSPLPDYPKKNVSGPTENDDPAEKNVFFFPLVETKGNSIPRFRQIMALKRSLEVNEVLFLIGGASLGKAYLVSLLAREVKYAEERSVISFSFNQHTNSLAAGLRLILIDQLKFPAKMIDNPIQTFFKVVSKEPFLILLNNVDLLATQDLMLMYNCNLGPSKLIMLSSSMTARSLCQNNSLIKKNIIELQELDQETVQNFFLERVPQGFNLSPLMNNKLLRFIKGNPLVLMLICAYLEKELRRSSEANLEEIFKNIENLRVLSDKTVPINLCKMLNLTLGLLSSVEKDILLFCSYLPIESISSSLVESIFGMPPAYGIRTLDALSNLGLMQRIPGEPLQNPRYGVHSSVKDYIYKEYRIDQPHLNELVAKIVSYYYTLLTDQNKLSKENTSFVISGILYSLRVVSSNFNGGITHLGAFFEKSVEYLQNMGLVAQIEAHIMPIYEENLKVAETQEMKAFWQRLLGLCVTVIASEKLDLNEKIEATHTGIDHLNYALSIYSNIFANANCRQLHNDLGNAYLKFSSFDEAENNLIKAIEHFKKAVQMQVKGGNNLEAAQSQVNLGKAYLALYKIKPSVIGLQLAIQILSGAIRSFAGDLPRESKSFIHQNLGDALRCLAGHEETVPNLQGAINEYKIALEGANAQNQALIYNSLGCCFWKLAKYHNPIQNLELAVSVYRKALEFIGGNAQLSQVKAGTVEYAVTQNNLGTSYKTLAALKDPQENLTNAINCFHEALYTAEKQQDHNLVKVVNQHLHELSSLVDNIISHNPNESENLRRFKGTLSQDLYLDGSHNRLN